jgi:DNA-binding IclR family transcriptional regulator
MAYLVTTALGRVVPLAQWGTIAQDLALKVLHDFSRSPFNPHNQALGLSGLARAAHLPPQDAGDAVESLVQQKLAERVASAAEPAYRITALGAMFVVNAEFSNVASGSL